MSRPSLWNCWLNSLKILVTSRRKYKNLTNFPVLIAFTMPLASATSSPVPVPTCWSFSLVPAKPCVYWQPIWFCEHCRCSKQPVPQKCQWRSLFIWRVTLMQYIWNLVTIKDSNMGQFLCHLQLQVSSDVQNSTCWQSMFWVTVVQLSSNSSLWAKHHWSIVKVTCTSYKFLLLLESSLILCLNLSIYRGRQLLRSR